MDFAAIYIVRGATSGRDFTPKLVVACVAIALVIWDWRRQRRFDYASVFVVGTLLWTLAEAWLSIQGVRLMPVRLLLGKPLPFAISCTIQAMAEGAFVAVVGLFVGDRLLVRTARVGGSLLGISILLAIALTALRSRHFVVPHVAASYRDVFDPRALAALLLLSASAFLFYVFFRQWRPRLRMMFVVMLSLGSVWSLAQVAAGQRWVELAAAHGDSLVRAGPWLTFLVLGFDVVYELAWPYASFFVIAVTLGFIRDPKPLPLQPTSVR